MFFLPYIIGIATAEKENRDLSNSQERAISREMKQCQVETLCRKNVNINHHWLFDCSVV